MLRYWYTGCPRCGREGELLIGKRVDTSRLCCQCAECFRTFDSPDDVGDPRRGYSGADLAFEAPTREEIRQYGWEQYCCYTVEEPGWPLRGLDPTAGKRREPLTNASSTSSYSGSSPPPSGRDRPGVAPLHQPVRGCSRLRNQWGGFMSPIPTHGTQPGGGLHRAAPPPAFPTRASPHLSSFITQRTISTHQKRPRGQPHARLPW